MLNINFLYGLSLYKILLGADAGETVAACLACLCTSRARAEQAGATEILALSPTPLFLTTFEKASSGHALIAKGDKGDKGTDGLSAKIEVGLSSISQDRDFLQSAVKYFF